MKRVMIVDDSLYTRLILRDLLMSHGYFVVAETSSGKDAISVYAKARPDIVIVDAAMPEMDGVATIRELKRKYPDATPILAASHGQRSAVVEALSAGAVDFIAKPYSSRRVIHTLRKTVG